MLLAHSLEGRSGPRPGPPNDPPRDHLALTGPRMDAGGPRQEFTLTFDTLGLSPASLRAVHDQGYLSPTPIQAQAIPLILDGRDLLAGAQTGTGKTAAFVLPMLERLHANRASGPRGVRALVVVPTRELALQVEQSVRTYGAHRPVRSTAIYGGVSMDRQVRALRGGVEIVVATPGRLLDHVRQGTVNLGHVEILVLDEADRMLDMGFIPDIRRILALLPTDRQSLLFSATFSPPIRRFAEDLLRDPASVDAAPRNTTVTAIQQVIHPVDRGRKRQLLSHLVRSRNVEQVLVFTRTKRGADRLAEQLGSDGINASAIHGNKSQSQRVRALGAFKEGRTQVLVATDIAARGLDIEVTAACRQLRAAHRPGGLRPPHRPDRPCRTGGHGHLARVGRRAGAHGRDREAAAALHPARGRGRLRAVGRRPRDGNGPCRQPGPGADRRMARCGTASPAARASDVRANDRRAVGRHGVPTAGCRAGRSIARPAGMAQVVRAAGQAASSAGSARDRSAPRAVKSCEHFPVSDSVAAVPRARGTSVTRRAATPLRGRSRGLAAAPGRRPGGEGPGVQSVVAAPLPSLTQAVGTSPRLRMVEPTTTMVVPSDPTAPA